ncbi:MAG: hypothetical protein JO327_06995 [Nitrososphaeraceae archaeon]|nr:hypothetical protein [Nitrososphaeraceae archaeon]MBV9667862.1 hypothetical protein [Nitrososphaeraceae archaeon]
MSQPNQGKDDNGINNTQPDNLEQGNIYYFCRTKKDAEQVKSIEMSNGSS